MTFNNYMRWLVLLVCIYGVVILGGFYFAHPKSLLDFSPTGISRLVVLSLCICGCPLMVSPLRTHRGRTSNATGRDSKHVSTTEAPSYRFVTDFRHHPASSATVLLFLFLFPAALVLITGLPRIPGTPLWQKLLGAGIFSLVALAIGLVRRGKRDSSS